MSAPVILDLSELAQASSSEIGSLGVKLAKLNQLAVPLPKTLIIPHSTWEKLGTDWQIKDKLKQICQRIDEHDPAERYRAKKEIARYFSKQVFPDWLSQSLFKLYHSELKRGLVRLLPGSANNSLDVSHFEHIQGDANLFESLKNYWLHWLEHRLDFTDAIESLNLIPTAVIIQEQALALASGQCFTCHPHSGNKSQIFIQAIKGAPAPELFEDQADQYVVDIRTWNVVFRQVNTQLRYFQRTSDQLESRPLDYQSQLTPNLTDEQCVQLAHLATHLKQQHLSHFRLDWELTPNGFVVTNQEQVELLTNQATNNRQRTVTKIMFIAGNPHQTNQSLPSSADGIGLFQSHYAYLDFGIHPQHICRSHHREVLIRHLVSAVYQFHQLLPHQPIIYQSLSLNSKQMSKMQYGAPYEQTEPNPHLGMRGGIKYLVEPELFELDLAVISNLLRQTNIKLGLQLPMVRSPQELSMLIDRVYEAGLSRFPEFELWWQLDTPDNILNLSAYPTHHLTGLSINAEQLQTLVYGVDPDNHYLADRYAFDYQSLRELMHLAAKFKADSDELSFTNQRLKLRLQLTSFNRELVEEAINFGYDGITVLPQAYSIVKATVLDAEQRKFANNTGVY